MTDKSFLLLAVGLLMISHALVGSLLGWYIAVQKRRSSSEGIFLGLIFGLIGSVLVALLPTGDEAAYQAKMELRRQAAYESAMAREKARKQAQQLARARRDHRAAVAARRRAALSKSLKWIGSAVGRWLKHEYEATKEWHVPAAIGVATAFFIFIIFVIVMYNTRQTFLSTGLEVEGIAGPAGYTD